MAAISSDVPLIERTLYHFAKMYATPEKCRTITVFDRERGHFLLIDEGWDGYKRIYNVWAHLEVQAEQIWIHEDGTEEGIANQLASAGVASDRIILSFQAPIQRRQLVGAVN